MGTVATREKFLLELMGIKFNHCFQSTIYTNKGTMSEWEYFGKLWEWAKHKKFWPKFKEEVIGEEGDGEFGPLWWSINENFICPEMFATALYLFLQEKKGETL